MEQEGWLWKTLNLSSLCFLIHKHLQLLLHHQLLQHYHRLLKVLVFKKQDISDAGFFLFLIYSLSFRCTLNFVFLFFVFCFLFFFSIDHMCSVSCLGYVPNFFWLFLSGAEIGRFVAMLRNPSSILKTCAAFALLQVTEAAWHILYSKLNSTLDYHLVSDMIVFLEFWSFGCSLRSLVEDMPCTMLASCRMPEQQEFFVVQPQRPLPHSKRKSSPGLFFAISSITRLSIPCRSNSSVVYNPLSQVILDLCGVSHVHNCSTCHKNTAGWTWCKWSKQTINWQVLLIFSLLLELLS